MHVSMRMLRLLASISLCTAGCAPGEDMTPDAGPDAGPESQGSPPRGDLVINEIAPQPAIGTDWIELHNRSNSAVDLCQFFITDSLDRLDHYTPLGGVLPPEPCEPRWLDAGAYLVIQADELAGLDHAAFELGTADEVHVVTTQGIAMDGLVYLHPGTNGPSLARQPDGEGLFYLAEPSQGEANPSNQDAMEVLP